MSVAILLFRRECCGEGKLLMIGDLIKIRPEQLPARRRNRVPLWKRPWFRVTALTLLAAGVVAWLSLRSYLVQFREKAETFDLSLLGKFEQSSILFDRDGREIGRLANENRTLVQYSDMPQYLIDALVATEDSRFWEHKGVDYRGIARAAKDGLFAGRLVSGGEYDHAAAGAEHVWADGAVAGAEAAGDLSGGADREALSEADDHRVVSEPDSVRERVLRDRGGGAGVFQQDDAAADEGGGGDAGGADQEPAVLQSDQ